MMLSAGLSTFASCNKAGSIPQFTAHLQRHPNDYKALMWRGRAYSIIGKNDDAVADFVAAGICSYGAKRELSRAMRAHVEGRGIERYNILQSTVRRYPDDAEAWSELGSANNGKGNYADALEQLQKATDLANNHGEFYEPWYSWTNYHTGEIYFYQRSDVEQAKKCYKTAVRSCDSLTVAHLGIGRCSVLESRTIEARNEYEKAKRLNPTLVHWKTFKEFKEYALKSMDEAQQLQRLTSILADVSLLFGKDNPRERQISSASVGGRDTERHVTLSVSDLLDVHDWREQTRSSNDGWGMANADSGLSGLYQHRTREYTYGGEHGAGTRYELMGRSGVGNGREGNGRGGSGVGGGNGSGGSGNGGGGNKPSIYERIKAESRTIKKSDSGTFYVKVGKSEFWLSRDRAGHGGSYCKVYEQAGNTLYLIGSVPINIFKDHVFRGSTLQRIKRDDFDLMLNKHESQGRKEIKLNSLNGVR